MNCYTAACGPALLHQYVESGYLLHGSPRSDLAMLEPRALTRDPQVDCASAVVFATKDPVIAVLFALLDRTRWCGILDIESLPRTGFPTEYRISVEATSNPVAESGTVWVVDAGGFVRLAGRVNAMEQWASEEPVTPVAAVPVTRNDLRVPVHWWPCGTYASRG